VETLRRGKQIALLGVVTLLVGLAVVLPSYLALRADHPHPTTTTTSTSTTIGVSEAIKRLKAFVPRDLGRCSTLLDEALYFEGELAAMRCDPRNLTALLAASYFDTKAMQEDYDRLTINVPFPITHNVENCRTNKPSEGEWRSASGISGGRLFCYFHRDDGHAWLEWTHAKYAIHVIVAADDNNMTALYGWWERTWSSKP
jgi:hypothetical protein